MSLSALFYLFYKILIRKEVSFFWFLHIMYCKGDKESPKNKGDVYYEKHRD